MKVKIDEFEVECTVEEFRQLISVKKINQSLDDKPKKKKRRSRKGQVHVRFTLKEKLLIKKRIERGWTNREIARKMNRCSGSIGNFKYRLERGQIKF